MNSLTKRWLSLVTAVAVMAVMCFGSIAGAQTAHAASSGDIKEKAAIVITGTGAVGSEYTEDTIGKEKAYTLDELKAMAKADPSSAEDNQYVYSTINTWDTKSIYKAEGVRVDTVLKNAGLTDLNANLITFAAEDGYSAAFDPARSESETISKPPVSTGLGNERYYFPNFGTDSEEGKTPVPTIIAWADGGIKGSLEVPEKVDQYKENYVCLAAGQLNIADCNNPLWNGETAHLIVTVGNKMAPVLTVNGKAYTRAEVLAMESLTRQYTYTKSTGETTEYAKGVPAADLMDAFADSDVIEFQCADGYDGGKFTKKELRDGNYILAYEKGDTVDSLEGIVDTAKGDSSLKGYFTLYGDGFKPAKLISSVSCKAAAKPEVTAPKTPASLTAAAKSYNSAEIKWAKSEDADGYTVYRSEAGKAYKAVKTTAAAVLKYTDKNLKTGTKYAYKVRAFKNDGSKKIYSADSAVKAVTPQLAKPVLSKAKAGKKSVTLSWKKVDGANRYKVYRAVSKKGTYKAVKTVAKGTSFTDKKLKTGKTYYYKIKAYRTLDKKTVYSGFSAVKQAKAK